MGRLVLSRHDGDEVIITVAPSSEPQTIVVGYVGRRWSHERQGVLTFEAGPEVSIVRREVMERQDEELRREYEKQLAK